jgi:hypothetical protein
MSVTLPRRGQNELKFQHRNVSAGNQTTESGHPRCETHEKPAALGYPLPRRGQWNSDNHACFASAGNQATESGHWPCEIQQTSAAFGSHFAADQRHHAAQDRGVGGKLTIVNSQSSRASQSGAAVDDQTTDNGQASGGFQARLAVVGFSSISRKELAP